MFEIYTFIGIPLSVIVFFLWMHYIADQNSMDIETSERLRLTAWTFTLALLLYIVSLIPVHHTKWYQQARVDYTARTELRRERRNRERINDYKTFRAQVDSVKSKYTKTDTVCEPKSKNTTQITE